MSYFGGTQGRGDPGFFDTLFRVGKGIVKGAVQGFTGAGQPPPRQQTPFFPPSRGGFTPPVRPPGRRITKVPGFRGGVERLLPGGRTGFEVVRPRRRRMNVGNAKALRRAIRRTDGFVRLARASLKNTGFKIVSKSSGKMTEAAWQKRAHHAK